MSAAERLHHQCQRAESPLLAGASRRSLTILGIRRSLEQCAKPLHFRDKPRNVLLGIRNKIQVRTEMASTAGIVVGVDVDILRRGLDKAIATRVIPPLKKGRKDD